MRTLVADLAMTAQQRVVSARNFADVCDCHWIAALAVAGCISYDCSGLTLHQPASADHSKPRCAQPDGAEYGLLHSGPNSRDQFTTISLCTVVL